MSAKPSKKRRPQEPAAAVSPDAAAFSASAPGAALAAGPAMPWIASGDPRRRLLGQLALVGVWLYVAALWLLALDQTFHWGLFGPNVPVVP